MMQYNHLGLNVSRKKKTKVSSQVKERSVDWINIFLFVLLFVVIILFIVT
jgi:hypothetical protein